MYIGPDALLPVTSYFAAVVGVMLMFWREVWGAVRMLFARFTTKTKG